MPKKRKRTSLNNEGLKLTDKHHPMLGIVSVVLAIVSFILFFIICYSAGKKGGQADIFSAIMGIDCFFISVGGFVSAWISLRQENIRTLFPTIGAVLNGVFMLGYLLLYAWGSAL